MDPLLGDVSYISHLIIDPRLILLQTMSVRGLMTAETMIAAMTVVLTTGETVEIGTMIDDHRPIGAFDVPTLYRINLQLLKGRAR